jgi:hypothetical protein
VDDRADRDHDTNMPVIAIEKGKRGSTRHTNLIRSSSMRQRTFGSETGADPKSLASVRLWKLSYGRKKRNKYPV